MEERRFDNLTKALAQPLGRRTLFKGLAAAAFGSALPLARSQAAAASGGNSACDTWCDANFSGSAAGSCTAAAAMHRGPCYQCGPASPNGGQGQAVCNGRCTSITTTTNCGGCGRTCTAPADGSATCVNGQCGITCNPGACSIGGACYPAGTVNPANACQSCQPGQSTTDWITKTCTPGDQCHGVGQCNPATGVCSNPDLPDGTSCNDNNACTSDDVCQAGVCTGTAVACTPINACYTATCDPVQGCQNTPKPAGTACSDNNACTVGDACDGNGTCVPGQQITCPPCQTCDQASGTCVADPAQAGNVCQGNGNQCFGSFVCDQSGSCAGAQPVVCAPLDSCHVAGTCDPATGLCSNPNAPDGTTCDNNGCTTCQAGICTPISCDDGLICTDDSCDPATGQCRHVFNPANCGHLNSCQTALCGPTQDCLIVNNDNLCPPLVVNGVQVTCLAPQCTDAGCSFRDTCDESNPECGGCADCSCDTNSNQCVPTCPT